MSGDVPDYYCRVCGLTPKPCMHTRATAPYGSEQAIWEASRKMFPPDKEAERLRAELAAARAERAITASPWRYKEWGGLVVGGGEGSAEVLICTMATNTRHDEGRHNRELIVEAPTLRARAEKAEAEAARLRAAIEQAPHGKLCASIYEDEYPCNCWKAAALQEGGR